MYLKFISVLFLFSSFSVFSQSENKKYHFRIFFEPAYSRFNATRYETDHYSTLELRAGVPVYRDLGKRWALSSGLNFSVKLKRQSQFEDGHYIYKGKGLPSPHLDDTASKRSHYAFEVPLLIHFKHAETLSFNAGVMGRFWGPTDLNTDILASLHEVGVLFGASKRISDRWWVGVDFYSTLAPKISLNTKNQFAGLKIEYILGRR